MVCNLLRQEEGRFRWSYICSYEVIEEREDLINGRELKIQNRHLGLGV